MRSFIFVTSLFSVSAFGQQLKTPQVPAPSVVYAPVEGGQSTTSKPPSSEKGIVVQAPVQDLAKRLAEAQQALVAGAGSTCAIPLLRMPIPPGVNFTGKMAPGPANVDKMPEMKGLPVCGELPKR